MKKRKYAFTLAETLIALVVIGVIAAITVPAVIQDMQKQEIVSRLKKTYSTLSQVTNQIIAEEGAPRGDGGWLEDVSSWVRFSDNGYELYRKRLNNAKDCSGTSAGCFSQLASGIKYLGGNFQSTSFDAAGGYKKLVLTDGVQLMFLDTADIWADLNGHKGPNVMGRDIFIFKITNDGLYPNGCQNNDISDCNPSNTSSQGRSCACKILREGAVNY